MDSESTALPIWRIPKKGDRTIHSIRQEMYKGSCAAQNFYTKITLEQSVNF